MSALILRRAGYNFCVGQYGGLYRFTAVVGHELGLVSSVHLESGSGVDPPMAVGKLGGIDGADEAHRKAVEKNIVQLEKLGFSPVWRKSNCREECCASWRGQSPVGDAIPQDLKFAPRGVTAMDFQDTLVGYAVTSDGSLWKTADGGN